MFKSPTRNKVLIIGGGIANFTDIAKTFTGVAQAIKTFQNEFRKQRVKIFVRRGGPNYQEGLQNLRNLGKELKIPVEVYGPEMYMTEVVNLALKNNK